MADTSPDPKKFSQLDQVTTLANSDIVVVVANGVTSTITWQNLIAEIIASIP